MNRARSKYVPADADRWVHPSEAAMIMGISRTGVMRLCNSGALKSSRPSTRRISIRISAIHEYMAQQELFAPTSLRLLETVRPMRRLGSIAS